MCVLLLLKVYIITNFQSNPSFLSNFRKTDFKIVNVAAYINALKSGFQELLKSGEFNQKSY